MRSEEPSVLVIQVDPPSWYGQNNDVLHPRFVAALGMTDHHASYVKGTLRGNDELRRDDCDESRISVQQICERVQ